MDDTFLVNETWHGDHELSAVSMAPNGAFVVAWSNGWNTPNAEGVFARQFADDGTPTGPDFRVDSGTAVRPWYPWVAMNSDQHFVVVWESRDEDGSGYGVFGRLFDDQASPIGPDFQINTFIQGDQWCPSVGMWEDGAFAVIWSSAREDGDSWGVYARRYDADGAPATDEFQINRYWQSHQTYPVLGIHPDGGFVAIWESNEQDGSLYGLFGLLLDSDDQAQAPGLW